MKTVTEKHDYASLIKMLHSSDEENAVVALQCIDHMDFNDNMVTILMLYKKANIPYTFWKEHAPNTVKLLKTCGVSGERVLTYADIMSIMRAKKADAYQLQLFVEGINETIKNDLVEYGYDFIEEISVKVKYKIDDTSKTKRESSQDV